MSGKVLPKYAVLDGFLTDQLADGLIEHESLDGEVLDEILAGVGGSFGDSPAGASNHHTIESPQPAKQMRAEGLD